MRCTVCECPLKGGTDTFGPVNSPLCMSCFFELGDNEPEYQTVITLELDDEGEIVSEGLRRERIE